MSEENKENGFNHVKTFTKIIFIFSVLVLMITKVMTPTY